MEEISLVTMFKNSTLKTKIIFIILLCLLIFSIFLLAIFIILTVQQASENTVEQTPENTVDDDTSENSIKHPSSLNSIINSTCSSTLYPSLCFSTLNSSFSKNTTTTTTISKSLLLEASINQTIISVSRTKPEILLFFAKKMITSQEKDALNDCLNLLDQTLYELGNARIDLSHHSPFFRLRFTDLKIVLSAAMTNEITCIDGFSVLEAYGSKSQKGLRVYLEIKLKTIIQMISNSLAIVKQMEKENKDDGVKRMVVDMSDERTNGGIPPWFSKTEKRRLMGRGNYRIKPNVVVAKDGSGDYRTIEEAIKMAPNMSYSRYVIKIKAGKYEEHLEIPRNKINIMLFGDGMNATVITGNRSVGTGYSTFTSATMTVIGDRFLARDLTIENTATPEMFQAVAIRVTSNSAFFRCNFTSNQDTLYAHSLRQFYRECVIQGTIDFIFGNAAAIFHNCYILVRTPILGQSNMITAQSREDPNQNTGFSLHNCTIEAAPDFSVFERSRTFTFLGRPWRNFSRTIVMKSYLGDLINPLGWSQWNEYSNLDTVEYMEYMNYGPGAETNNRVTWKGYDKNCSEDVAKRFTVGAFLHAPDDWLQSARYPLFHDA